MASAGSGGSPHPGKAHPVSAGGPDGPPADMQYTVIVAVRGQDTKEFLMVRHKTRGWELPGGKLETMEGPVHCALREFREETGHLLGSPHFVMKLRKPNGTCFVFTGGLGPKVDSVRDDDPVGEMQWFSRLPREEGLAWPDDPYPEMGQKLGIDFG